MRAPGYWILCVLLGGALLHAPVHAAASPQRPKEKPAATLSMFPGNLKQARLRAAERNVPIVAIALLDKEPENVAARIELLASAEIAALSQRCVLFFSNHGKHAEVEVVETVDGEPRSRMVCADFRTASCREHQQHWDDLYNAYNENGELRCPSVLVLAPDGKLEKNVTPGDKPEVSSIVAAAGRLQEKLGRGLDDATLARLKAAQARAAKSELAGENGTAYLAFAEVLEISPEGPRAAEAKLGQERVKAAFAKQRDAAQAKLDTDDCLAGYLALEALAKEWLGTEESAEITRTLRRAEKEPRLKEALAKKKREDDARALWDEAQAAKQAGKPKELERKVKLLLRKFPGTEAYEKAAKAHPEWVPVPAGQG